MQYNVSTFWGGGVWFSLKSSIVLNINVTRAKITFFVPLEEQANRRLKCRSLQLNG